MKKTTKQKYQEALDKENAIFLELSKTDLYKSYKFARTFTNSLKKQLEKEESE